jgi:hypothetical protein
MDLIYIIIRSEYRLDSWYRRNLHRYPLGVRSLPKSQTHGLFNWSGKLLVFNLHAREIKIKFIRITFV